MLTRSFTRCQIRSIHTSTHHLPIIHIKDASFYRRYPSSQNQDTNPPLFSELNFSLSSDPNGGDESWAVISPSSIARTTFLQILQGQFLSIPPNARTYPFLSAKSSSQQHAVKYVGFDAEREKRVQGSYLSARYESRREETDFSVLDYLTGHTELNALETEVSDIDQNALEAITKQLNLSKLLPMPVTNLSNGQTRRARIAKALMARPEVLLLDGPFMGLDPNTAATMSSILGDLAHRQLRLLMSLRPEDVVPEWVSHLVVIDKQSRITSMGARKQLEEKSVSHSSTTKPSLPSGDVKSPDILSRDGFSTKSSALVPGEALIEMRGVRVSYGDKTVLGGWEDDNQQSGLWWSLHRGQRCGIFGANGSGKTTMLSLITSDHPQTYSLPIKLFGRSRLPQLGQPGISVFDIQRRMGHSSPEVHAFFPKQLSVRRVLESAWADAPLSKAKLSSEEKSRVDACLRWFARELNQGQKGQTTIETLEDDV